MRFHKRLRHRPLLQALAWFPPSLRYISQICRHTLHIYIYTVIYQSKCIYIPSDICTSKLQDWYIARYVSQICRQTPPQLYAHHHLRCVKREMWSTKNLYPVREVRLEVTPCCKICPKTDPSSKIPPNSLISGGSVWKQRKYLLQKNLHFYNCVQVLLRLSKYGACPSLVWARENLRSDCSEKTA